MSRRRNLLAGYHPAPPRGFLPRGWRRSACAWSSSPELRYAARRRGAIPMRARIGGRLERLAGRGSPVRSRIGKSSGRTRRTACHPIAKMGDCRRIRTGLALRGSSASASIGPWHRAAFRCGTAPGEVELPPARSRRPTPARHLSPRETGRDAGDDADRGGRRPSPTSIPAETVSSRITGHRFRRQSARAAADNPPPPGASPERSGP